MPPTPQHSLQPSSEAVQLQMEVEGQEFACEGEHRWTARDRVVIARMERYLNESDSMKVAVEELKLLLGPADSDVDLRYVLCYARKKKGRKIFEHFQLEKSKQQSAMRRASKSAGNAGGRIKQEGTRSGVSPSVSTNRLQEGC